MPLMNWNESYSVGIPSIDAQHRELIELINGLHADRLQGETRQAVRSTLDRLLEYAQGHFRYEESLFERTGYPDAATHVAEHGHFLQQILSMQHTQQSLQFPSALELMDVMIAWLNNHMVASDKKYAEHLAKAGIA